MFQPEWPGEAGELSNAARLKEFFAAVNETSAQHIGHSPLRAALRSQAMLLRGRLNRSTGAIYPRFSRSRLSSLFI
jgi:hypothetical protein